MLMVFTLPFTFVWSTLLGICATSKQLDIHCSTKTVNFILDISNTMNYTEYISNAMNYTKIEKMNPDWELIPAQSIDGNYEMNPQWSVTKIMNREAFIESPLAKFPDLNMDFLVSISVAGQKLMVSNLTTVFLPVIYIIIFITGLPTNVIAIWVFLFRTKKRRPASILMVSLALADLLFIIWLPLKIIYHFNGNNWIFGDTLCKVLVGSFYTNMYSSTIFIAIISVQRYWAVVHPLSNKLNNCVSGCVSVLVWVMVWLLSIPLYVYDQTVRIRNINITTCHDVARFSQSHFPAAYFLTMSVVGFVVPCIVCVVAYVLMFHHLKNSTIDSNSKKTKKKAIRLMIVVLVLFLVSFTPSNILLMMHYSKPLAGLKDHSYSLYIVALCLSSLNSCIDPVVYYFISKDFREHVKNMLICRSERTAKRMKISSTENSI